MKVEAPSEEVKEILNKYKSSIQLDDSTGQIFFEDIPVIFARAEFMSNIYSELEGLVGVSAGGVLRSIGRAYGFKFFDLLSNQEKELMGNRERLFSYLCAETQAIGWGDISIEEQDGKIIILSEKGLAPGHNSKGKSQQAVDFYFLGYFEGFLSKLDGIEYHAAETQCVAKGDPVCKMEFGTEPVF